MFFPPHFRLSPKNSFRDPPRFIQVFIRFCRYNKKKTLAIFGRAKKQQLLFVVSICPSSALKAAPFRFKTRLFRCIDLLDALWSPLGYMLIPFDSIQVPFGSLWDRFGTCSKSECLHMHFRNRLRTHGGADGLPGCIRVLLRVRGRHFLRSTEAR